MRAVGLERAGSARRRSALMRPDGKRSVALVGAGFIADAHLAALSRRKDAVISAVVDPVEPRANALAKRTGAPAFASVDRMLAATRPDAAHILTPPPRHRDPAVDLLRAGVACLVEKPFADTQAACREMIAAADESGAALAINHNFAFHPIVRRAQALLEGGRIGPLVSLQMSFAAPLRQLGARQLGAWMFQDAGALLLEQAVHPLSATHMLLGALEGAEARAGPVIEPAAGVEVAPEWRFSLDGEKARGQLAILLGASFPSWTFTLLGADGRIDADIFEGRLLLSAPRPTFPQTDFPRRSLGFARQSAREAAASYWRFLGELTRLGPPADGFTQSMTASIDAFHDRLAAGAPPARAHSPAMAARLCEICRQAGQSLSLKRAPPARRPADSETFDLLAIGGTGFIGAHLVRAARNARLRIAVMARNTDNLDALFHEDGVGVFRGALDDDDAIAALARRVGAVVNLAHGGGGPTRAAIVEAMADGAVGAYDAARRGGAARFLHASSSAALYLGDANETITLDTPADPHPEGRADYAAAKIIAERRLAERDEGDLVIFRPAIVVGRGGQPFHSALGVFENETHCLGWNHGSNPLPFVLAEDVASAILAAWRAPSSAVAGKSFNIVGEVRWSARQYLEALAAASARPLRFHPSAAMRLYAEEALKYGVKRMAGRGNAAAPSLRDIRSRGMAAAFAVDSEKALLDWRPCADEAAFREAAINPFARSR